MLLGKKAIEEAFKTPAWLDRLEQGAEDERPRQKERGRTMIGGGDSLLVSLRTPPARDTDQSRDFGPGFGDPHIESSRKPRRIEGPTFLRLTASPIASSSGGNGTPGFLNSDLHEIATTGSGPRHRPRRVSSYETNWNRVVDGPTSPISLRVNSRADTLEAAQAVRRLDTRSALDSLPALGQG